MNPDARERLLKDAQERLDRVQQNIAETVLWRVEVVEDGVGNHLKVLLDLSCFALPGRLCRFVCYVIIMRLVAVSWKVKIAYLF